MSTTALSDVSCPIDDDYVRCRWPAAGGLEEVTIKADHGDPFQLASSADFWDFFGPSFEDSRPDTLSGEPVDGPVDSLYPFLESRWGEVDVTQGSMPSWSERGGEPPPRAPSLAQEIDSVGSQGSISPAWYGSYSAQSSIGRQTCTHCSESFTNGKELEKHAVESNHRSYRCPSPGCEKTYCRRDVLLRHKATHKDVTQLQCEHCLRTDRPRSFARRDHYNQHLRTHHPHALGPHYGDSVKRRKPEYDESTQKIAKSVRDIASRASKELGSDHAVVKHIEHQLRTGKQPDIERLAMCVASAFDYDSSSRASPVESLPLQGL